MRIFCAVQPVAQGYLVIRMMQILLLHWFTDLGLFIQNINPLIIYNWVALTNFGRRLRNPEPMTTILQYINSKRNGPGTRLS